jgi:hypothetical protein
MTPGRRQYPGPGKLVDPQAIGYDVGQLDSTSPSSAGRLGLGGSSPGLLIAGDPVVDIEVGGLVGLPPMVAPVWSADNTTRTKLRLRELPVGI